MIYFYNYKNIYKMKEIDLYKLCNEFLYKSNINSKDIMWNNWTDKSENIPFISKIKGVGDGEEKIAHELNSKVLGQNSDYDMKITIDNKEYNCDIKKLDNNTFNTGVKGRNALRPIKNNISELLEILKKISNSHILTETEKCKIKELHNISPDEICVSNIQKINDICIMLNEKQENIVSSLPNIYEEFRKKEVRLDKYSKICELYDEEIPEQYHSYKEKLIFLKNISHIYILTPKLLIESLNNLVNIFNDITLIFVDEKKGYCIWNKLESIKFERITRGHPRFRILI